MTKAARCAATEHDYVKFNDSTVVCRKCADQSTVTTLEAVMELLKDLNRFVPCTLPHYPTQPYWYYPVTSGTWVSPKPTPTITYTSNTL